jgi:hypothetical protein
VAALTTRDWLVVSTLLAVAVIYLVIPPLRRRLRIYRAELEKRHPG